MRAVSLLFAIVLASSAALADSDQLVVLHDGSRYRGTLVELVPDDHVTIKLATGEVRRFAWADIEKTAETSEQSAATTPPPGVFVTLDAPRGAVLQRRTGTIAMAGKMNGAAIWSDACEAPCNTNVLPGAYRIGGSQFRGSNEFDLPPSGRVRVDARLGSASATLGGAMLAIFGGALIGASVVNGVLAIVVATTNNTPGNSPAVVFGAVSGIAGGLGIALLIPGIVLVANNTSNATVTRVARAALTGVRF